MCGIVRITGQIASSTRTLAATWATILAVAAGAIPASAQDDGMRMDSTMSMDSMRSMDSIMPMRHDMGMMMDMGGGWRMVPMDTSMPMLPGMEGLTPTTSAFLPGMGMDPAMFPDAHPSEVVAMRDRDTLDISVSMVRRTIAGHEMVMYGYNGQYPGPLIQAPKDATVVVRVTNDIQMPTTIHWHGVRIDNRFDGVPNVTQRPIERGESFTYEVNVPDAGMFWYHPHVREDVQQDLGLFGNLLVTSPDPDFYGPANRDEIFVLDDILMDAQGPLPWGEHEPTHALMGRFGNVMMVNGETDHRLEAAKGEVIRFFLTNVANTRTFNVTFGNARVKIVGSDIGRYEREQWVPSVVIAPAERYIVDVRFEEPGPVAITNSIQAVDHFRGTFYPHVDTLALVTVSDESATPDLGEAFASLRENEAVVADIERFRPYFDKEPDHELETTVRVHGLPVPIVQTMEMDTLYVPPMEFNDAMPMMNWLSTGAEVTWILRDLDTGAENGDIDWRFKVGDVVKIRVFNNPKSFHPMNHPFHIHGQRFLVVSMDGMPASNLVWKDTAIVPVGSTMDFLVEMTNPGTWMAHCHIAEHLHSGMMFSFVVEE